MSDKNSDVDRAVASVGGPMIVYHSFGPVVLRPRTIGNSRAFTYNDMGEPEYMPPAASHALQIAPAAAPPMVSPDPLYDALPVVPQPVNRPALPQMGQQQARPARATLPERAPPERAPMDRQPVDRMPVDRMPADRMQADRMQARAAPPPAYQAPVNQPPSPVAAAAPVHAPAPPQAAPPQPTPPPPIPAPPAPPPFFPLLAAALPSATEPTYAPQYQPQAYAASPFSTRQYGEPAAPTQPGGFAASAQAAGAGAAPEHRSLADMFTLLAGRPASGAGPTPRPSPPGGPQASTAPTEGQALFRRI